MNNTDKRDIDELFREGLNPESDPVIFLESDWSILEQRLNWHARRKRAIFWLKPLGGVAALLLLGFSIWLMWPVKQKPPAQQITIEQKDQQFRNEQNKAVPSLDEIISNSPAQSVSSPSLALNVPIRKQPEALIFHEDLIEDVFPAFDSLQLADQKIRGELPGITDIPENQFISHSDSVNSSDQSTQTDADTEHRPFNPSVEESDQKIRSESKHRRLALSILVAPDYNGVNDLNNAKVGSDVGLLLTIGLTDRWSFSTGAVYAKKLYETGFSNYNPTNDIWSEYDPQSVDADCRVLDIPLNLNYAVINKGNTTISLGAGISSYIMLKEDYRFIYAYQYSQEPQDIHLVNENQHWLSVLNLQANYERNLNSKISISIQPYLKIPFADIGFAGVRLQTVGMALSANWNL